MGVGVVVVGVVYAAHKPAHGGKVDKAAGGVGVGFVLADNAAHGTPALVDIVGVYEPLAAGAVGDLSRYIVKSRNAAQVAVGKAAPGIPAHQRDFQLAFGAALGDFIHALQGLERSRQRFFFGALGGLRLAACALRVGGVGQHADHGVQVGVPGGGVHLGGGDAVFILFIRHGQPVVDFLHEGLRILAAAGGDAAAVGACHAAHKAAVRGDRAAGVVSGNGAVAYRAAVAAHDAADVRGVCHFGGGVLAGAHVGRALHVQRNVVDRAALHCTVRVVAANDAADRAADDVDAAAAANGALIGTPNQSTAVAADNAAQIAIFVHALGQVSLDRNRIVLALAANSADVFAHGTARRYGVGGGGKVGEIEGFCFNLTVFDRARVVTDQTAYLGGRAVQGHAVVITAQGNVLNDSILRMSGGIGGVLVDCGNAANGAGRTVNVNVQQSSAVDMSIVVSRDAASLAVSSNHMAADGHGIYRGPGLVAAGNAACVTAARIQRIGGCAAIIIVAVLNSPVIAARQTAHVLVINMDAARRIGDIADRSLVAACRTASLVVGGHAGRAGKGDFFVYASGTDSTRCTIHARYTADLAGAADLDSSLAAHAIANDRAHIIPRHAADGGDALDPAGGFGQANGAGIVPRRAADVHAAADGNASRRGRVGDAAVVDARDAAEIAVVFLRAAHGILHAAAGDRAVVDARQAARRHGVLHAAVVGAVLQRRIFRRIADDAARKVAVAARVKLAQRDAVIENVRAAVGRVRRVAAGQAAVRLGAALAAVDGVGQGKAGPRRVVADDAAHVGVRLDVEPVAQPRQRNRGARRGQPVLCKRVGGAVKRRQQRAQCIGDASFFTCQRDLQGLVRHHTVVADDAARHAVSNQAARADGSSRGRGAACVVKLEAILRQVRADNAAHKVDALNFVGADLHGGQLGRAIQADDTAHAVTGCHNGAGHVGGGGMFVYNGRLGVVVARHAADKIAAVQHRAQRRAIFGLCRPMDLCVGAVVARHAADKIGIVLRAARRLAELVQQVDAVFIGRFDGGHAVGAVLQGRGNIVRQFVVFQQAPGRIVDACDTAHIGRTLAQARHKTLVGHVFDRAVFAVDRDNAAHIAVAEHIAVVLAAGCLQVAAHKAADKAADKAAAQHIAGLGAAVSQGDIAAKADQTADEIALQGAFLVQRTIRIVARPHQGGQGGGAQAAAGGAGAALQLQVAGIARNAAKELAQHRAFLCRSALVVGPGQHRARVVQLGQGGGLAAGRVQVARNAARKAVAHHGGLVGNAGQGAHRAARIRQVGDVQHTGHAAHADSTPKRFCGGRIRNSVIACLFGRISADFGRGAVVFGSIGIGKQARDGDIFVQRQVAELRPVGRHGKADEPANAVRLVCSVGSVYAGGAGGLAVKRQRRRDLGLGPTAAAAVDRAVGHAAGIHTGQRPHRVNLCAVGRVFLGKRLQIPGAVRVDRHGIGQLLTVYHDLGIDLHIGVAQGDFRQCTVVFADQTHIVVTLAVVQPAAALLRRDRGAAQLQVADDDVAPANFLAVHAAGQGDVFAHGGDGRPGYELAGAAGHLGDGFGQPGSVLFLPRAVDGHAAVGPVQRGRGVGGQCAVIPCIGAAVDPAQVIQVAEIFQCSVIFRAAEGKEGVLGVGLRLLALGAGIGKSIVGTCFHFDIDILRAADQPRHAEQRRLGRGLVIFRRAQ